MLVILLLVYTQTYPVCKLTGGFISNFRMFMYVTAEEGICT